MLPAPLPVAVHCIACVYMADDQDHHLTPTPPRLWALWGSLYCVCMVSPAVVPGLGTEEGLVGIDGFFPQAQPLPTSWGLWGIGNWTQATGHLMPAPPCGHMESWGPWMWAWLLWTSGLNINKDCIPGFDSCLQHLGGHLGQKPYSFVPCFTCCAKERPDHQG